MKGKLIYDQGEWWVQHMATSPDGVECFQADTMLHPDDVKFLEDCNLVFDNLEARININPDVEFEMVTEVVASVGNSEEQDEYTISYAKLIPSKEEQKQLITEIMDLDAKDGLYDTVNNVEKLADNHVESLGFITFTNDYSNERRTSFIDGYNKAKETLYTEEDMLNAFYDGWLSKDLIWKVAKKLFKESLKQPKKD
jgi:hypothetical protein